ncbi:MAG: proline racemase family protein [Planctomycetota bacterium]
MTGKLRYIDSHTGGEPTRVVLEGGPDLGTGPLDERLERLARDHDTLRTSVILEPRGSDAMVGALLCEPTDPKYSAGVIFFNNVSYLGMCGHGTIGLMVTLAHLGRLGPGNHLFETPVGPVEVRLLNTNTVEIENVPSWRYASAVAIDVEEDGRYVGDIAWGGNWFYLTTHPTLRLTRENIPNLLRASDRIREALRRAGITGANGGDIDHVEFFGPPDDTSANGKNFVNCPGGAYDRSPCGTGTSAKLACLAAEGKLAPGETWVQESILGSQFHARYRPDREGRIVPMIQGSAYVCAEGVLVRQPGDPFADGIH